MANYHYFVPFLVPAPPPGFTNNQIIPLEGLRSLLDGLNARIEVRRELIFDGAIVQSWDDRLVLENDVWTETGAERFSLEPHADADWQGGSKIAYLETRMTVDGAMVSQLREPGFYTIFSGPDRKTFLSDSSQKVAHPAVINQVAAFGQWMEGYPSCVVDPDHDAGESIVFINPYERPALATVNFDGLETQARVRLAPFTAQRVSIADIITDAPKPWTGQIYVHGPRRVVTFFMKHSLSDPSRVNTLEHTDVFRGERLWRPLTQAMHWKHRTKLGVHKV